MNIVYSASKLVAVIGFVYFLNLYGAILGFIVAPIIALIAGFHWPRSLTLFPYKKLMIFSLPLIGFAIIAILPISLDLFFVKSLLKNNHLTGLYNAVGNIADIPFYALGAFAVVLFPNVSRLTSQNNYEEARQTINNALRVVLILLVPAVALLSGGSRGVLRLLYSNAYADAAPALAILAFGIGFLTLFTILANILNGSGRAKLSVIFALVGIIMIAMLCPILIPKFGLEGAAMSTSIGCFTGFVLSFFAVRNYFRAHIRWLTLFKVMVVSGGVYLLSKVSLPPYVLPVYYAALFTAYLAFLYLIGEITKEDLALGRNLIPSWVPFINHE